MPKKEPGFAERLQTAAKAKKGQLEKISALAPANGVPSAEGQAARLEAEAARKMRTAGRKYSDRVGAQEREAQCWGAVVKAASIRASQAKDRSHGAIHPVLLQSLVAMDLPWP